MTNEEPNKISCTIPMVGSKSASPAPHVKDADGLGTGGTVALGTLELGGKQPLS